MSYRIMVNDAPKPDMEYWREHAQEAVNLASRLMAKGRAVTCIIDRASGVTYKPDRFHELGRKES